MDTNKSSGIVIGSDHAGWELKEALKKYLAAKDLSVVDVSEQKRDPEDDYPIYSFRVAKQVASGKFEKGIVVCGTGIGASIAANRVRGIRAALCLTPEMGAMAKKHNNANVLALGARTTPTDTAFAITDAWLATAFEGGRHSRRVQQLDTLE
jgi:ribose 5-phosphate isomerase B